MTDSGTVLPGDHLDDDDLEVAAAATPAEVGGSGLWWDHPAWHAPVAQLDRAADF